MTYDDAYFDKAQEIIMDVLDDVRPELMQSFGNVEYAIKGDKTVVTELDGMLELKLKTALKAFDPEAGYLGEELGQEGDTDNYWLLDPIDGTESFIRGLPTSRNQMAFMSGGKPIFALVYNFPTQDLYVAKLGKGTTKNGKRITLTPKPLNRCWIDLSVDLLDPETYASYQRLRAEISGITVMHDYLPVVEGLIDGSIMGPKAGPWDYVPRALLCSESGMRVGNIGSMTYDPKIMSLVATYPDNFEELQKLLSGEA